MEAQLLRSGLEREVDKWAAKTVSELREDLVQPRSYVSKIKDQAYQAEVQLLEDLPEYLHVVVAVDDLTLRGAMGPLSTSFLVYSDGRVDR